LAAAFSLNAGSMRHHGAVRRRAQRLAALGAGQVLGQVLPQLADADVIGAHCRSAALCKIRYDKCDLPPQRSSISATT